VTAARANRDFLQRAVTYCVQEAGIRQFLDIGTGLPTADNTHEVAQRLAPDARVVYVDNDPLVMVHARALLTSSPEGRTDYIEADLREPAEILGHPQLAGTLDLSKPVALMLVATLHFLLDDKQAYTVVKQLVDRLAPGSYLVATHATADFLDAQTRSKLAAMNNDIVPRDRDQFTRFFTDLDLVEPGVEVITNWRPDPGVTMPPPEQVSVYGAVARIPGSTKAGGSR
jgi:SAM-dependent methyltransferase